MKSSRYKNKLPLWNLHCRTNRGNYLCAKFTIGTHEKISWLSFFQRRGNNSKIKSRIGAVSTRFHYFHRHDNKAATFWKSATSIEIYTLWRTAQLITVTHTKKKKPAPKRRPWPEHTASTDSWSLLNTHGTACSVTRIHTQMHTKTRQRTQEDDQKELVAILSCRASSDGC